MDNFKEGDTVFVNNGYSQFRPIFLPNHLDRTNAKAGVKVVSCRKVLFEKTMKRYQKQIYVITDFAGFI